jgi:peptidoglycan/LPS O-acetylase OafA/YrhL
MSTTAASEVSPADLPRAIAEPKTSTPRLPSHIPALDGIRGIAILMVMFFHFVPAPSAQADVVSRMLYRICHFGFFGVDLFFVLSGFLITGILWDAKQDQHYFRNFYMRRTLRIFPLYYGVLFFTFVIVPFIPSLFTVQVQAVVPRQGWLWFYCSNILTAIEENYIFNTGWLRLGHFWSLAVEEQFYLFWPFVVLLCNRKWLMGSCVAFVLVALAIRIPLLDDGRSLGAYVLTPTRMDELATGAFLAVLVRGPRGIAGVVPWAWVALGLSILIAILGIVLSSGSGEGSGLGRYPVMALFFGGFLILAVAASPTGLMSWLVANTVLRFFGKYSYGLYVFHPIILELQDRWASVENWIAYSHSYLLGVMAHAIVAILMSVVVAMFSWHIYEKHFIKFKALFEYQKRAA